MLISTKDGIACDICGTIYKNDFVYYAATESAISPGVMNRSTPKEYDICTQCFNRFQDICKKYLGKFKPNAIKCDMCPKYMAGKFIYYKIIFDRVIVKLIGEGDNKKFTTDVDKQVLDYNICENCHASMIQSQINKNKQDEWT